jgi:hypothetical protein
VSRSNGWIRAGITVAVIAAPSVLAGCSGIAQATNPAAVRELAKINLLGDAIDRVTGSGVATVRMTSTSTIGTRRVRLSGPGRMDFAAKRAAFTLTAQVSAVGESGPTPGSAPDPPTTQGQLDQVITDEAVYLRSSAPVAGVPAGTWMQFTAGAFGIGGTVNPTVQLELLRRVTVGASVSRTPDRSVAGEPVVCYLATIDAAAAPSAAVGGSVGRLLTGAGIAAPAVNFCIDRAGRLRLLTERLSFRVPAGDAAGQAAVSDLTVEVTAMGGQRGEIVAPPSDQVVPAPLALAPAG